MPVLSIITINKNNKAGLQRTIGSVVSQTSRDIEYIVIDGASTDGSVDLLNQYNDSITYWVSEPDTGIYNAMNKGIRKATGEYCQFLNSGDWLASDTVVERLLSNLPACSIFYGNMVKLLPGGKKLVNRKVDVDSLLTFYSGTINHSSSWIKRALFEKYGPYDERLRIVSDWKFFLIAVGLHAEPVEYIDIDVTCFDMHGISNTNHVLDKEERKMVLQELLPANIFRDYEKHWPGIGQMDRLNRYRITKALAWFIERCLFKWEKFMSGRS